MKTRVSILCFHRVRADQAPNYGGPYTAPARRPIRNPEKVGQTCARRQPDGSWRCDECGATITLLVI